MKLSAELAAGLGLNKEYFASLAVCVIKLENEFSCYCDCCYDIIGLMNVLLCILVKLVLISTAACCGYGVGILWISE